MNATQPKYPDIQVELTGQNGNALMIIGRVSRELRELGVDAKEIEAFSSEAMSGDYDHLLQTVMAWVHVS